jgi:hypothetical protein
MSIILRVMIVMLVMTMSVEGSIHRTGRNSKSAAQDPKVSLKTKKILLARIKAIYGKEPVKAKDLELQSPGSWSRSGLLLLRTKRFSYLITNPCDYDWSEMVIYVFHHPRTTKAKRERQCVVRKLKIQQVEITQK